MFSDLPRPFQREMLRLAFAAVLSSTFFVTLGILSQPIPSRSFAMQVPMPWPPASYAALVPATPAVLFDAPVRRPLRPHATRPPAAIQLASVTASPSGDNSTPSEAGARQRRPNLLGRLFRGMLYPTRVIAAG